MGFRESRGRLRRETILELVLETGAWKDITTAIDIFVVGLI